MFRKLLFSDKLKYIGLFLMFIMIVLPMVNLAKDMYVGTLHLFGGETKTEKIRRLTFNVDVLADKIMDDKKELEFTIAENNITTSILNEVVKETIVVERERTVVKKVLNNKITAIKNKIVTIPDVIPIKHDLVITNKPPDTVVIVDVVDEVAYRDIGEALATAMYVAFNNCEDGV